MGHDDTWLYVATSPARIWDSKVFVPMLPKSGVKGLVAANMSAKQGYRTVSLPRVLTDKAEAMIDTGKWGYRKGKGALVEYVSDLIRRDLQEKGFLPR